MAEHSTTNLISKVQLPGSSTIYEIHDLKALHTASDITALLGDTLTLMNFKGSIAKKSSLPTSGQKVGDVYYVVETDSEWIWVAAGADASNNAVAAHWEEMGSVHNHVHDATLSGTASVTLPALDVSVTGSITPQLTPTTKAITANKPTVTPTKTTVLPVDTAFSTIVTAPTTSQKGLGTVTTKKYKITTSRGTNVGVAADGVESVVKSYTPSTGTFVTGTEKTTTSVLTGLGTPGVETVVRALGTPTTDKAIKSFGTHTTATVPTAFNTTSITPWSGTPVTASKVTIGTTTATGDVGNVTTTANKTTFSVSDGLLTISNVTGTIGGSVSTTITTVDSKDVTASLMTAGTAVAAYTGIKTTAKPITVLGTASTFDAVKSYTPSTAVVSTGYTDAPTAEVIDSITNKTASALTALNAPSTVTVLTGVKVSQQPAFSSSIVEDNTNGTTFVTGVGSTDITISAPVATTTTDAEGVEVLSSVDVAAPTLNNAGTVVTSVTGKSTAHTLTGTIATRTLSGTASVSGDTGSVKSNAEH